MSNSWIKMRSDLHTDPKVLVMTRLLFGRDVTVTLPNVTNAHALLTHATVSGLLQVWASVSRVMENFHPYLTLDDLDRMTAIDGFGEAMHEVGWVLLDEDGDGLVFPNFQEFNTPSKVRGGSSGAERTRRWRERQKAKQTAKPPADEAGPVASGDASPGVTVTRHSDGREEKSREEIKPPPPTSSGTQGGESIEGKAAADLVRLGVDFPLPAVRSAVRSGATAADLQAICQVFRDRSGAWTPAALQARVTNFVAGQAPDRGWPDPDPKWIRNQKLAQQSRDAAQNAQEREERRRKDKQTAQEREQRHGAALDAMTAEEIRGLILDVIPEAARKSHLDKLRRHGPDGYRSSRSCREQLLLMLDKSQAAPAAA